MRMFLILICSLSLALFNAGGQQEPQGKGKKKPAPTQQGAPQHAKPAEYGKTKGGAYSTQVNKPPQYGKPNSQGHAVNANKPAYGKPKGQGQVNTNKPAEYGKAKGKGQVTNPNQSPQMVKGKGVPKGKPMGHETAAGQAGAPNTAVAGKPGKAGYAAGKPFKPRHFEVAKQPNTAKAPPVRFQQNRHIEGSEHWQGQQYTAFRNYHAEWHDQNWWHSHYHNNITFVFGSPYYFNAGYWYPAWGYTPNAYYAWDGPIYAYNHLPPDQVIANVQAALQQQGYYHGDVDGLIGPLTRAAIADYQRDQGLYQTSAIDQPTLASLGMA